MPIKLDKPLDVGAADAAEKKLLDDLQGNILNGHGRKSTRHLLLKFKGGTPAEQAAARALVHELAALVTSAKKQFDEAKRFRDTGVSGGPFVGLMISSSGYAALGATAKAPQPNDGNAFAQGMLARAALLDDPAPAKLDKPYRGRIDAMVLIGADPDSATSWTSAAAEAVETQVLNMLGGRAELIDKEVGRAIFKDNGTDESGIHKIEGIEHFGYVDGRSQPLLLKDAIERERDESDGISVWDPTFPIGQVLVPDPGAPAAAKPTAFGSFFVFRKLEQDVKAFKAREEAIGDDPTLGKLGELAGAMLVGRFEDGTPVVLQRDDGADNPVPNNFDYAGDPDGLRCPIHAHIRKTNPRGESVKVGATLAQERGHIMARRGMTYGVRDKVVDPTDEPSGKVGLMFMSFHRSLAEGFEFTQASWANNAGFLQPGTGRDPIMGQRGTKPAVKLAFRDRWGSRAAKVKSAGFDEFVRHKGGEYFFAPARSTLASL